MHVLLTGAAGFIGSHLAERLLDEGHQVRGLDRFSQYYDPAIKRSHLERALAHPRFALVEGDLTETNLRPLVNDVEVVFHLAAQPGVRPSWGTEFDYYLRDNVLATQRLLEASSGASLYRFVLASSSSVYGQAERFPTRESDTPRPISPYGVTKLAAEHLVELYRLAHGIPTLSLRYFTVYGPRQRPDMAFARFIEAGLSGTPVPVYGDGMQTRSFTYVEDAVSATVAAAYKGVPGGVYNVAGGSQGSVREVISTIGRLLDRPLAIDHLPAVRGDPRQTGGDTSEARAALGFEPLTTLQEGLARQVDARLVSGDLTSR